MCLGAMSRNLTENDGGYYHVIPKTIVRPDATTLEFHASIHAALGERLKELWLFGSRARGDHQPGSDYDFLVVADGDRTELEALVAERENEILLRRGDVLASIVYTPQLWERARNVPLGLNVRREGMRIA